jgi:DNA invertase Pin-like site-specific DNA recombinase
MKIGYARVSTKDQNLDSQLLELSNAGCEIVFTDKKTGKSQDRSALQELFTKLRKDDVVVVTKLDRLARNLKDLIDIVQKIHSYGANFKSLKDQIDTSSPSGKFFFHVFGAIAEFEREMISERTIAGLTAARARGRKGGRPSGLNKEAMNKALIIKSLYEGRDKGMGEIAKIVGLSRSTCYRYLDQII